jgi:hypothetical protein
MLAGLGALRVYLLNALSRAGFEPLRVAFHFAWRTSWNGLVQSDGSKPFHGQTTHGTAQNRRGRSMRQN